ncbi:helix-turn-helix domain-containing protein [Halobacteriales archaeon QS_1_68_17]|nr:MAG: helix-turn-helix domain-containing protein [Halobacteriales archaeon QS_1_68_17]
MPVIAAIHISHPDLVLTPTIRSVSEATIRVVPQSATDPETRSFAYLVDGCDPGRFETALTSDHTVVDYEHVATVDGQRIYQITYAEDVVLISPTVSELGGLSLESRSDDDGWAVKLQLPDRDALAALNDFCQSEDVTIAVNHVVGGEDVSFDQQVGVTAPQREALLTALELGYFEQPRDATLEDVADEMNISSTAASGRLRRGMATLVERTLADQ